jgi:hypothetical protein
MRKVDRIAKKVFDTIVNDLFDRRGLRQEWDQIDDDTLKEIYETNIKNITKILNEGEQNA